MSFFKRISKKVAKDASKTAGTLVGNAASQNAQNATNAAVDGMSLFRWKVSTPIIQNGTFEAQKGNLFEYIEAAKFNTDAEPIPRLGVFIILLKLISSFVLLINLK